MPRNKTLSRLRDINTTMVNLLKDPVKKVVSMSEQMVCFITETETIKKQSNGYAKKKHERSIFFNCLRSRLDMSKDKKSMN